MSGRYIKNLIGIFILVGLICGMASAQGFTGDRIWDADANQSLEYTWNSQSYSGFYYDLDSGEGSETLTIKLDSKTDRSIAEGDLVYSTKPTDTDFEHDQWGSYQVIGFMAERYFAGYTESSEFADDVSLMSDGQLAKVLIDDDEERSFFTGASLVLEDGYKLDIIEVDLDGNKVFISLKKDGIQVDTGVVSSNDDYVYERDVGSSDDVAIIAVHFNDIFRGTETNAVFVEGIFQISDQYVEIDEGDSFGKMEITTVSSNQIEMENDDSISLSKGKIIGIMGKLRFIVADDDTLRFGPFLDMSEPGAYELRGTVAENDELTWTPLNFEGFYYNIDEGIGTESLEILNLDGRSIDEGDLLYSTTAEDVTFEHDQWGKFQVIGFMAEKYFAGYPKNSFTDGVSMLSEGQLSKVLIDNDERSTIVPGSSLVLEEDYEIRIDEVDINGDKVLVSLRKNGRQVDSSVVPSNTNLVYKRDIGSADDVPIIIVHFADIFRGTKTNAVFVEGMFQISDKFVEVDNGDRYDKMEVTRIDSETIEMENEKSITLSKDKTISIMSDISFKVADSDEVRYYPFVTFTTEPSRALSIEMSSTLVQGTAADIIVNFRGATVSDALVLFEDDEVGLTSNEGMVSYTPDEIGTFTVTAQKEGFVSATKEIQVISSQDENRKVAIEVSPDDVYEGDTVTISLIKAIGGDPVEGVQISYDGVPIGNTSAQGTLSYTVEDPGVHKITSASDGFLGAELNLKVLAFEPEFEFSNLVISPTEIDTGENVTITVDVMNIGTAAGEVDVELMVNGNMVDSRMVSLDEGEKRTVKFTRSESEEDIYEVQIGSQTGTYTVTGAIPSVGFFASMIILGCAALLIRRFGKNQ